MTLSVFVTFAVASTAIGFVVNDFRPIFAGLPTSGIFSSLGSDFLFAYPTDGIFWIGASFLVAKYTEYRSRKAWLTATTGVLVGALIFGFILGSFVEPTGDIF